MQRRWYIVGAVVAGAALLGWAVPAVVERHGAAAAPPQPAGGPPPVPVTEGVAEMRDMPVYVRGIGSGQAYNSVSVRSRVDGQIVKVDFTEGQNVKAGDLLFEIDPRSFQAAFKQATANKEKDQAALVSAQADLNRYTQLVGHGFQTRQTFDQQKALVGQLEASIKADQAQIDAAQLNLQYADIRSPIDGRTGARLVDIGNLVHAADNTSLVTVTQVQPIFVSFTVPQKEFDKIRASQRAGNDLVEAVSESDETPLATGRLTLIDNQIDQATGTLHLKATFENRDETLWPGEFVTVRVVVATRKNAVTVPARTVQNGPDGAYVFVVKDDSIVDMRPVEITDTENGLAIIDRGLAAGERIVIDGQFRLEPGTPVISQAPTRPQGAKPGS